MRALIWFPALVVSRTKAWAIRHPWLAKAAAVIAVVYVIGWALTPFANAAGDGKATPDVAGDAIKTTAGIRASHYAGLFIDHGWFGDASKSMTASFIDFLWSLHYGSVTQGIDMLTWVLGFGWVDWLVVPFRTIAQTLQSLIAMAGVIPFALTCMSVLVGIYVLRGKFAKAITEYLTACIIAVLAVGVLANPIIWLSGSDGPIYQARDFGANVSAAITSGKGDLKNVEASSKEIIGASVTRPLADMFIARPAEFLSFGHTLTGDCKKTVDQKIKKLDPLNPDLNAVRDAVGGCDKDGKAYADSSSFTRVIPVLWTMLGSGWLLIFGGALMVVLFLSVLGTCWNALQVCWRGPISVFPFTDRSKLLMSLALVFAGLVVIVVTPAILAGGFKLLLLGFEQMDKAGYPAFDQVRLVGVLGLILVVGIVAASIAIKKRAKRAAAKAAQMLENVGASQKSEPLGMPGWVAPLARHMDLRRLQSMPNKPADRHSWPNEVEEVADPASGAGSPPPLFMAATPYSDGGSGGSGAGGGGGGLCPNCHRRPCVCGGGGNPAISGRPDSLDYGHLASTPTGDGQNSRPQALASTAVRYAMAAKGGYAGVALEAGKDIAQRTLSRRIEISDTGRGIARPAAHTREIEAPAVPALQRGFSSSGELGSRVIPATSSIHRIQIGADGNAQVVKRISMAAVSQHAGAPLGGTA